MPPETAPKRRWMAWVIAESARLPRVQSWERGIRHCERVDVPAFIAARALAPERALRP